MAYLGRVRGSRPQHLTGLRTLAKHETIELTIMDLVTKALKSGKAEIEAAPIKQHTVVKGMAR